MISLLRKLIDEQGNRVPIMINRTALNDVQLGQIGADWREKAGSRTRYSERPAHLAVILPRGEAIRNFVYSGVLEEISREAQVTLLSVIPDKGFESLLRDNCHELISLQDNEKSALARNVRDFQDMVHLRWLWSEATQESWRVADRRAKGVRPRLKRATNKLAYYAFAHRTGLKLLSNLEDASSNWLRSADEYIQLFRRIKPTLVFNSSPVNSQIATPIVKAAQHLHIPTATFIFSWDTLLSEGRISLHYDYYLVWNETQQNQLLEIYDFIRPEQVIITGTPQFDLHFRQNLRWTRDQFCNHVGADPNRPIVLYSTGRASQTPGEPALVEGIAAMLREMDQSSRPQLLVRLYPKDHSGRFEDVWRRNPDILFPHVPWERSWLTPHVEDAPLLINMLLHCAVGINIASTMSLELCMFDKPVINIGYNPPGVDIRPFEFKRYYDFDDYREVVECGAVRVASSEAAMRELLQLALTDPQADSAKRMALIRNLFGGRLDGYSGMRVAHCLVNLGRSSAVATAVKDVLTSTE